MVMTRWPAASASSTPSASVPSSDAGSADGGTTSGDGAPCAAGAASAWATGARPEPPRRLTASGVGGSSGACALRQPIRPTTARMMPPPMIASIRRRRTRSQPCVLEPVGVRAEHRDRAGLEDRRQAEQLVDLVEVVHREVVAHDLAEVAAAPADEAVRRLGIDQRREAERRV